MLCVVYGISSDYLGDVLDSIDRLGWTVVSYVCNIEGAKIPLGISPVCLPADIESAWLSLPVIFPQITPGFRLKLKNEAKSLGFSKFATVVDPTAIVSSRSHIAEGVMVNAGAIIAAHAEIHDFAVLNRGASIGHNSVLEEYVSFGPGAVACGSVRVQKGAFVGAGAIINPKVTIGENALIGAGAVVTKDVPARCQVVGNPGRVAKTEIAGYNDVLVYP